MTVGLKREIDHSHGGKAWMPLPVSWTRQKGAPVLAIGKRDAASRVPDSIERVFATSSLTEMAGRAGLIDEAKPSVEICSHPRRSP